MKADCEILSFGENPELEILDVRNTKIDQIQDFILQAKNLKQIIVSDEFSTIELQKTNKFFRLKKYATK